MVNATNLRPQIVLLLAEVERIGHNFPIEVAREADFNLARGFQVLRLQVGQGLPRAFGFIRHPVRVLVDARAASFSAIGSLVFRQIFRLEDLTDVIVFAGAGDFAPETEGTGLCLRS